MKTEHYNILTVILHVMSYIVVAASLVMLFLAGGCTNFKATSDNGDELLYQRVFMMGTAELVDIILYDPNGHPWLWVTLNDPNSGVNSGGFKLKEPYLGIEVSGEAK